MNPHFKLPLVILLLTCSACSVAPSNAEKHLPTHSNPDEINITQTPPSPLQKTTGPTATEIQNTAAYLDAMHLEIRDKPGKYLKIKHYQDPNGPLLVSIKNSSNMTIEELSLVSRLFDSKSKLIKHQVWHTKAAIEANTRSRYYLTPVTYHLKPGEQIETTIQEVRF